MAAARIVDDGPVEVSLHGRFHIPYVRQNRLKPGLYQLFIRRIAHPPAQHHLAIIHHRQLLRETMLAMMMAVVVMVVIMVVVMVMTTARMTRHIPQFFANNLPIFNLNDSTFAGATKVGANCLSIIGDNCYFHLLFLHFLPLVAI
jgi:hypothetical protein